VNDVEGMKERIVIVGEVLKLEKSRGAISVGKSTGERKIIKFLKGV
jgi:hypothetical protein